MKISDTYLFNIIYNNLKIFLITVSFVVIFVYYSHGRITACEKFITSLIILFTLSMVWCLLLRRGIKGVPGRSDFESFLKYLSSIFNGNEPKEDFEPFPFISNVWLLYTVACIIATPFIMISDGSMSLGPYHETSNKSEEIFGVVTATNCSYYISERTKYDPVKHYICRYSPWNDFVVGDKNDPNQIDIKIIDESGSEIGERSPDNKIVKIENDELDQLYDEERCIYVIKNTSIDDIGQYVSVVDDEQGTIMLKNCKRAHNYLGSFSYKFDEPGFWSIVVNNSRNGHINIIPNQCNILNQTGHIYFIVDELNEDTTSSFTFKCSPCGDSLGGLFVGDIICNDLNIEIKDKEFDLRGNFIILSFNINCNDLIDIPTTCQFFVKAKYTYGYKLYKMSTYEEVDSAKYPDDNTVEFNIYINKDLSDLCFILADLTKPTFDNGSLPRYYNISYKTELRKLVVNIKDNVGMDSIVFYRITGGDEPLYGCLDLKNIGVFQNGINALSDGSYTIYFNASDKAGNTNGTDGEWTWQFNKDTNRPQVMSTNPIGRVELPINESYIEFNEPMNDVSLYNIFILKDDDEYKLECEGPQWNKNRTIAWFKLKSDLKPDTRYYAKITTAAKDGAGNNLKDDYEWEFKTVPWYERPEVYLTSPENGNTSVTVDPTIRIKFTKPMDLTSVLDAFSLKDEARNLISCRSESVDDETICFRPVSDLDYDTRIYAKITTTAKDEAGNNLKDDYEWEFKTVKGSITIYAYNTRPGDENGAKRITGNVENISDDDNCYTKILIGPTNNVVIYEFEEDHLDMSYNNMILHVDCEIPDCEDQYADICLYIYNYELGQFDISPIGKIFPSGKIQPMRNNAEYICIGTDHTCCGTDLASYIDDDGSIQIKWEVSFKGMTRDVEIKVDQFCAELTK